MIFISHRKADTQAALDISKLLNAKGVQSWVDVLDPVKTNTDITKHIMSNLDKCSHVIVMYSINTKGSLWVPFELGAAYKGDKGIATYHIDATEIPAYLEAFPRMKSLIDLNSFVTEYQKDQKMVKSAYRQDSYNLSEGSVKNADSFINRMKKNLGQ